MKQQPISIITVQQKFKDWRDSKLPGAKIPKELWNIVRQILFNPKNKITVVTHGLGISTEQLRQKFPEYFDKRKKPPNHWDRIYTINLFKHHLLH